jgi:hypothetical protein
MVALRATKKVLKTLQGSSASDGVTDTALGDWYVNRLVVHRQPLLLLLSARSLLSILTPARDVRALPSRLPDLVGQRLARLDNQSSWITSELAAMEPVVVGPTRDRSVLGSMVDFAKAIPYYLDAGGWDESTLPFVESRLATTPCRVAGRSEDVVFPYKETPRVLAERWCAANEIGRRSDE